LLFAQQNIFFKDLVPVSLFSHNIAYEYLRKKKALTVVEVKVFIACRNKRILNTILTISSACKNLNNRHLKHLIA